MSETVWDGIKFYILKFRQTVRLSILEKYVVYIRVSSHFTSLGGSTCFRLRLWKPISNLVLCESFSHADDSSLILSVFKRGSSKYVRLPVCLSICSSYGGQQTWTHHDPLLPHLGTSKERPGNEVLTGLRWSAMRNMIPQIIKGIPGMPFRSRPQISTTRSDARSRRSHSQEARQSPWQPNARSDRT